MKKIVTAMIMFTLMIGVMTGCRRSNNAGQANGGRARPVELRMFLLGDPAPDYNMMLTELNKLVLRDLNATLRVSWIGWGDFTTRYPLVLASGEPIDIIYTSNWAFFSSSASRGAFIPLNDLFPEYAPLTFAEMPEVAIGQATINNNIYMKPMNYDEINPHGWVVRGDLRRKYNIPEIRSLEDFGAYLDAVARNEQGIIPFNAGPFDVELQTSSLLQENFWSHNPFGESNFLYDMRDPEGRVVHLVETPQYEQFVLKMREWNNNSYWSRSVLQNRIDARDSLENGRSAALILNISTYDALWQDVHASNPHWDLEWFMMGPDNSSFVNPYINNGMAIPTSSRHPELAMRFLEKIHQDEEYYNFLFYGIRGVHYDLTADNRLMLPAGITPDNNRFPAGGSGPWGFMDRKFHKESAQANPETERVRREVLLPRVIIPTLINLVFDGESVKTEIAAVKGLENQYFKPLNFGLMDDPLAYLAEYREMLRRAGVDRVKAEMQKQVDEYLAARR